MAYYDTNGNGAIDYNDAVDASQVDEINYYCDFNGDGMTSACEVHQCLVLYENDWRDANCPGYGDIYCDCPFTDGVNNCPGAWSCEDIMYITNDVMAYWD